MVRQDMASQYKVSHGIVSQDMVNQDTVSEGMLT